MYQCQRSFDEILKIVQFDFHALMLYKFGIHWCAYIYVMIVGYQWPPKIISTFKNEHFYPRGTTLNDASFNCTAQNGQIQ